MIMRLVINENCLRCAGELLRQRTPTEWHYTRKTRRIHCGHEKGWKRSARRKSNYNLLPIINRT